LPGYTETKGWVFSYRMLGLLHVASRDDSPWSMWRPFSGLACLPLERPDLLPFTL